MKRFLIIAVMFLSCAHSFAQWEKVDDPWDDENMSFLVDIGINAVEWYMEKFNL